MNLMSDHKDHNFGHDAPLATTKQALNGIPCSPIALFPLRALTALNSPVSMNNVTNHDVQ